MDLAVQESRLFHDCLSGQSKSKILLAWAPAGGERVISGKAEAGARTKSLCRLKNQISKK
jgi:hypothetical protein